MQKLRVFTRLGCPPSELQHGVARLDPELQELMAELAEDRLELVGRAGRWPKALVLVEIPRDFRF